MNVLMEEIEEEYMVSVDEYNKVNDCIYKDEHYSVRDNGAIMRHKREGKAKRKYDETWSFGIPNPQTGYMMFCNERVHRIVATAFHGPAPTPDHVVDHIDTNRQNNRPENLRWCTRLENALNNPITRKKIEYICGSIEAFLDNPQLLWGHEMEDSHFTWMKTVTKEEAKNCLDNWNNWASSVKSEPNISKQEQKNDKWMFENPFMNKVPDGIGGYKSIDRTQVMPTPQISEEVEEDYDNTTESLTPSARQRYWRTPTNFPFCPNIVSEDGLQRYLKNLNVGEVFSKNDRYDPYYVVDMAMSKEGSSLIVLATNRKDGFLSWAITTITIENNKFVHENTEAKAGKELSQRYFNYLIGKGELSEDDEYMLEALD